MRTVDQSLQQAKTERRAMLKIGEVSKRSGIGIEALRFYERSGLLDTPSRTYSGYRMYDANALERLAFIKRAQILEFSLDEIKRIIGEKRAGQSPCTEVRETVRRRLHELNKRMREMCLHRIELAEALGEWDKAGEKQGHICGLIEETHIEHDIKREQLGKRQTGKRK